MVYGIKPKKPVGAYKIFLQKLICEGRINSINEGEKEWNNLDKERKEEYLKLSHRLMLYIP